MAIAVLFKLDVPKVQDTGNDSKEMLIMGDIPLEHIRLPTALWGGADLSYR